jgi:hypothetical protein
MKGPSPFENIRSEISQDLAAIRNPQDHTHDELKSTSTVIAENAL